MADEIDPCPFCRGVATVSCLPEEGTPRVFCNDCFCWGSDAQTEAEAIAAWNKRAPEPAAAPYTDNRPHMDWCSLKDIEYGIASCGCLHPDAVPPDAATPGDEAMQLAREAMAAFLKTDPNDPVGEPLVHAFNTIIQRLIDQRDAAFRAGQVDAFARAARKLELRQHIFGGEPMTANEASIARHMLDAILALEIKDKPDEQ